MSAGRGLRPAHNRNCPRIGADGLSLRPIAWPHVAKRHWLRQQHDNMIGPRILGASAHIVSGSFREPDTPDTNQTVLAVADAAHALAAKQLTCSSKPP
jgi:hypothetical protein